MRILARALLALSALGLIALAADFLAFVNRADAYLDHPATPEGDGVAALTGGSDARIIEAVRIASEMRAPLLISGVHVDTSPADIAAIVGVRTTEIQCCVTLGRAAATTQGNGAEIAAWAGRHGLASLVVVTSEYHMDRALLELRKAAPATDFRPHAVASGSARPRDWLGNAGLTRRLVEEWIKFRVAGLRPRGAAPAMQAPPGEAVAEAMPP